ncbi:nuclear transport factor 2 family protein [Nocardia jejuensis]|uniref:nuclear transport factor 2 family protein n=1 Tax=Nocardia jejuensis TaxID=328049 RepID=UPI00082983AC|nr:nuclear transport factor 2 family protein [Nocardia jejuensis]
MSSTADTTAVLNLIARYAELVDDGDFAGVGALFADGVFTSGGASVEGAEGVEKMLRAMVIRYEDGTPRTHHVTTNTAVEFDGTTATARSYFTVLQALPDLPLQPIVTGRYRDRFHRQGDRWQFAEREVHIRLTGDLSGHLRTKLPRTP